MVRVAAMPRRTLSTCSWISLALASVGCLEDRLDVEILTQVRADGSCLRRVEYRLERVDLDRSGAHVEIRPEDDPLTARLRFPSREPWRVQRSRAEGTLHVVAEAELPAPCPVDADYERSAAPGAAPARNSTFLAVDAAAEATIYDWGESFRDPASPIAAARRLAAAAASREDTFAAAFERAVERRLDRSAVRAAYRRAFIEPFSRKLALLSQSPSRPSFREAKEVDDLLEDSLLEQDLVDALAALPQDIGAEEARRGVDQALDALGPEIEAELNAAGLPLAAALPELLDPRQRVRFRAQLVMPAPVVRANACFQGETVTWEFDQDDLFGQGFTMWARAMSAK